MIFDKCCGERLVLYWCAGSNHLRKLCNWFISLLIASCLMIGSCWCSPTERRPVGPCGSEFYSRVIPGSQSHASLKVGYLNFLNPKFKALKVRENRTGAWKSLKFIPQILDSPSIHQVRLRDISNFVKQVFCLKQDLLIIVMFCFYILKLSRNHIKILNIAVILSML